MTGLCIGLAAAAGLFVLPERSMTLAWTHSVEDTRWEEDYTAVAGGLVVTEARIEALGAGMEPPAEAARDGRWWRYRPDLPILGSVRLANSSFGRGYEICDAAGCRPLAALVPRGEPLRLVAVPCTLPEPGADGAW